MIEFILRVVAVIMMAKVGEMLFPTYWGGFYVSLFVSIFTSIRFVNKEEVKDERS